MLFFAWARAILFQDKTLREVQLWRLVIKLWVLCAEKEMSKAELRKRAGISSATFTKLRKNQEVTLSVILKIAEVLDCNAGDMMDFIKDDEYAELEDVGVEEVW